MHFNNDDLRLLSVGGPTMITMLESRQTRIINRIHSDYRSGKTEHLTSIAELVCVREQIKEIESALKQEEQRRASEHASANARRGN